MTFHMFFFTKLLDKQFPIGLEEGTLWGERHIPADGVSKNIICHNLLWEPPPGDFMHFDCP